MNTIEVILSQSDYKDLLKEAKENIDNGQPEKLLHKMVEDYMYMSSSTYFNWFNENSELNNLPIISNPKHWSQFESIDVQILTFSGSNEEDYYKQLELLKNKALNCKNFEYRIINDTGHTYNSKEIEIGNLIYDWIRRNF